MSFLTRITCLTWITCNNVLLLQKREERASAFQKDTKLTDQKKKKWLAVIKNELVSSERAVQMKTLSVSIPYHGIPQQSTACLRPLIDIQLPRKPLKHAGK